MADFLQRAFVSIKVIAKAARRGQNLHDVHTGPHGQGGWPLKRLSHADSNRSSAEPIQPDDRTVAQSFIQVLKQIDKLWETAPRRLTGLRRRFSAHDGGRGRAGRSTNLMLSRWRLPCRRFIQELPSIRQHGRFRRPPKCPTTSQRNSLMRYARRFKEEEDGPRMVLEPATGWRRRHPRSAWRRFARTRWMRMVVPISKRCSIDNASWRSGIWMLFLAERGHDGQPATVREILELLCRDGNEHRAYRGGFTPISADSEGHEGTFYCWTAKSFETAQSGGIQKVA